MKDLKIPLTAVISIIATLFASWFFIENRFDTRYAYAEATAQKQMEMQKAIINVNYLTQLQIINIKLDIVKEKIATIEDKCGTTDIMKMPQVERNKYRKLLDDKIELEKERERLLTKK